MKHVGSKLDNKIRELVEYSETQNFTVIVNVIRRLD